MSDQVSETLILDKVKTSIIGEIDMPKEYGGLKVHNRIEDYDCYHDEGSMVLSTACWRQYIGAWEIVDDALFLNEITGKYQKTESSPLFAGWYTGVIELLEEEPDFFTDGEYRVEYTATKLITIVCGKVVKTSYQDSNVSGFVSRRSRREINRLIGAAAAESDYCFTMNNEKDNSSLLIVFQFVAQEQLELYFGKLLILIQNNWLPLQVTTSLSSSLIGHDKKHSLIISAGAHWVQDVSEFLCIYPLPDDLDPPNIVNHIKGVWDFDRDYSFITRL
ncbi:hypothetical protein Q4601_12055 [Shewanella sp. 1_MG-2023]|uniref:hypothetical protein n=1 Tax=unclassified Shewanella TaxID=196818 RepID=UPI0026E158F1|nr:MULTISPECIES: hypothetical protein [unclassified Shewanella]MDO6610533.1 hypothetical protein [Shewanella sp. 7_MG-2023]MDO6770658.1 hypothetical protein [Shewanella sp. 2_MG-2023]MDO6795044.1 hypothetical protein [Shewanella sp. 1_MG-2023]